MYIARLRKNSGPDELAEDFRLFGMHQEASAYERKEPEVCEIWLENAAAVNVFAAVQRQWNVVVYKGFVQTYLGLDHTRVRDTLEMMGIRRRDWPGIFNDLQIMELAALPVLNERDA